MVDSIKGCTEINLHDPSLLPTLKFTLQCMGHAQKCITGTQTFPIIKLDGWKCTNAFQKSSPDTQTPWTILMLLKSVGNWKRRRTSSGGPFGIRVTFAYLQSWETTQTNKLPKYYIKTGGDNVSSSLKKMRKHSQWVSATIREQV